RTGEAVSAALARQGARLSEGPYTLLKEQGIGLSPPDQDPLKQRKGHISAEESVEQLVGTLGRQRINHELAIIGLAAPDVAVLVAVAQQEQEAGCRQALD